MDRATPQQIYYIYLIEISSAFATTIAVFLHTLKFRKIIGPRTSFIVYAASYLSTFYSYYFIGEIFLASLDLALLALGGLLINFYSRNWQIGYQVIVFALLISARYEVLPLFVQGVLPLTTGQIPIWSK